MMDYEDQLLNYQLLLMNHEYLENYINHIYDNNIYMTNSK